MESRELRKRADLLKLLYFLTLKSDRGNTFKFIQFASKLVASVLEIAFAGGKAPSFVQILLPRIRSLETNFGQIRKALGLGRSVSSYESIATQMSAIMQLRSKASNRLNNNVIGSSSGGSIDISASASTQRANEEILVRSIDLSRELNMFLYYLLDALVWAKQLKLLDSFDGKYLKRLSSRFVPNQLSHSIG